MPRSLKWKTPFRLEFQRFSLHFCVIHREMSSRTRNSSDSDNVKSDWSVRKIARRRRQNPYPNKKMINWSFSQVLEALRRQKWFLLLCFFFLWFNKKSERSTYKRKVKRFFLKTLPRNVQRDCKILKEI